MAIQPDKDFMDSIINTWGGRKFNFLNPEPTDIFIEDIAHALSLQCRFNGHCTDFYSVAEHSVEVMRVVESLGAENNIIMTALLHDAAEAYIGDVVSPLKKVLKDYQEIERRVESTIAKRFSLVYPMPEVVGFADKNVLEREFRTLDPFSENGASYKGLEPKDAEELFLKEYRRLSLGNVEGE
tara:strand:+ start:768 stop:1316 length:549 start_codon:yes stop_codon:yes gene_type:complete